MDYFIVGVSNTSPQTNTPVRGSYFITTCGQYAGKAVRGVGMVVYCNIFTPASRYVIIQQATDDIGWMEITELEVY